MVDPDSKVSMKPYYFTRIIEKAKSRKVESTVALHLDEGQVTLIGV